MWYNESAKQIEYGYMGIFLLMVHNTLFSAYTFLRILAKMQALRKVCVNDIPISVFDLFGDNWSLAFFGALTLVGALFCFFMTQKAKNCDLYI